MKPEMKKIIEDFINGATDENAIALYKFIYNFAYNARSEIEREFAEDAIKNLIDSKSKPLWEILKHIIITIIPI